METSASELHLFFLPLLAPGHMIPMVDLVLLLSAHVPRCTIVTTPGNAALILPSLSDPPNGGSIQLLTIPFSSTTSDNVPENLAKRLIPELAPDFYAALCSLEPQLELLVAAHRPSCIISDSFYPWTASLAKRHGIPRIAFHGSSHFTVALFRAISTHRPYDSVSNSDELFLIPNLPHPILMTRSQTSAYLTSPPDFLPAMTISMKETYGTIMNTFYELEPAYAGDSQNGRCWNVGPLCLFGSSDRNRGGISEHKVLEWLDGKEAGSVLYVCFGSLARFTETQLGEIRKGLSAAGRPFVWVVRDEKWAGDLSQRKGEGFVIEGWAPQMAILRHEAVGAFLTHCGWNSCSEGITAGVPMLTWPLFSDQHYNERLLVDVLGVAVTVGVMVNSTNEEERNVVSAERVAEAVEEVMGRSERAEERRRNVRDLKLAAAKAVTQGGSSEMDLRLFLCDLLSLKKTSPAKDLESLNPSKDESRRLTP